MQIHSFSAQHCHLGKYKFQIAFLVYFLSLLIIVCFCNAGPIHAASGDLDRLEPRLSGSEPSKSVLASPAVPKVEFGANVTPQSASFDSSVQFTVPGIAGVGRIGKADSGYSCRFTLEVLPFPLHAAGGKGTLNVHVRAEFDDGSPPLDDPGALCPWVVYTDVSWISGAGFNDPSAWTTNSKIVDFDYFNNNGAPRVGKILVAPLVEINVIQAGAIRCGEVITGNYRPNPLNQLWGGWYPFEFPADEGDWIVQRVWYRENAFSEWEVPVSITLPGTGVFSFSDTSSQTGSYRVSLQFIKGGNCSSSIACGQVVSGQITTPLQMNAYRFSAIAGEMVEFVINKTGLTSGSFWPSFRLYNPSGSEVRNGPLPETGTYTINVEDSDWYSDGLAIGTYDVDLQFTTGRCANTIDCGQAFIGIPLKNNQMDGYKFSGSAGERVGLFLNSTSGTGSTNGALFDPDGQFVTGDVPGIDGTEFGGGAQSWTLPKTGNYFYLVNPGGGTYDLYRPCRGLCDAQLLGSGACLSAAGGIGTICVLIGPGCPWTSNTNASWAAIVSGGSANKLWPLTYQAGYNAGIRRNGTLTIAGKTFNICQIGMGDPAAIQVTPTSLNFGDVHLRSTKDLFLTVKNTGGGTLAGNATTEAPFSIFSGGSYSLGTDQSQVVTIRYQPTFPGTHTGEVVFTGGGGATVPVTGKTTAGLPWLMLLLGE